MGCDVFRQRGAGVLDLDEVALAVRHAHTRDVHTIVVCLTGPLEACRARQEESQR